MKIVSGGQTGVDRAALDVAIFLELEHGGWCPLGRRAEDGVIPLCYRLRETDSPDYGSRTEANVIHSDGTLVLHDGPLTGGTALTAAIAQRHHRPLLLVDLKNERPTPAEVQAWLVRTRIETLNVAGPRESTRPGIGRLAEQFLVRVLARDNCSPCDS